MLLLGAQEIVELSLRLDVVGLVLLNERRLRQQRLGGLPELRLQKSVTFAQNVVSLRALVVGLREAISAFRGVFGTRFRLLQKSGLKRERVSQLLNLAIAFGLGRECDGELPLEIRDAPPLKASKFALR